MRTLRRLALLLFLASALLAQPAIVAQDHAARIDAFKQFALDEMRSQKMPALSVAIMQGEYRWSGGFGWADIDNEVAARSDSSYRMASVTKPMTAVAVLKLADEGKIDLDAEVQTYVPYFPRKSKPVTVRQLLEHQGGISHYKDYEKEGRIREHRNTREALAIFQDWDLIAEPGTAYNYSSYGFNLLGAVIEGASGKSYGEYMTENVWKPLGMTSTRMDDPRAIIPHRVTGYVLDDDGTLRRSEYIDISSRFAAGGTRSTVEDMLAFIDGIANGKILKTATRDAAWTAAPTRDGRFTSYGLGFGVYARNGRWVVAHSGSQQETRTELMIVPSAHFAVALASNFENADLDPFEDKLIELFLGDPAPVNARANSEADDALWRAINESYQHGLAYYDRYGKAVTTDPREMEKAFQAFRDSTDSRETLTKVGSFIAATLAKRGSLDLYHREGALRFFADYGKLYPKRVNDWLAEWSRVFTPDVRKFDLAALERHRDALAAATIKPDYARELIGEAESSVEKGDAAKATRIATLAVDLYPNDENLRAKLASLGVR